MRLPPWRSLTVPVMFAVTACTAEAPAGDPITDISRVWRLEIPLAGSSSVDVLFVIDNSPSMSAYGTKLDMNYHQLMLAPPFGPDLHVGVVTTDPVDGGRLRTTSTVEGSFISTELQFDGSIRTNFTGLLGDAFAALASA